MNIRFKEWVQILENAIEQEIMNIYSNNPKLRANKIAGMMRDRGYNLGYTQVADVIKKWNTGMAKPSDLWIKTGDKILSKRIFDILRKRPDLTAEQVLEILKGMAIFAELWQVKSIMSQAKLGNPFPVSIARKSDDDIGDASSVPTYFGYGTGGGFKVNRSSKYH